MCETYSALSKQLETALANLQLNREPYYISLVLMQAGTIRIQRAAHEMGCDECKARLRPEALIHLHLTEARRHF